MLPFWRPEFWGGSYICGKVVDSWSGQEISHILRNSKVRFHVHKRPPLVPVLSQINPGHSFPALMLRDIYNIIFPYTTRSSMWSTSLRFLYQNSACTSFLPHTFHVPLCFSFFFLTTRITFREEYVSWSSSSREDVHFNKPEMIIPHVLSSKFDRGVQGPGGKKRYLWWRRYNGASVWPRTAHLVKWRGPLAHCAVLDELYKT